MSAKHLIVATSKRNKSTTTAKSTKCISAMKAIDGFKEYLDSTDVTSSTIAAYLSDIKHFKTFLQNKSLANLDVRRLTKEKVCSYFAFLKSLPIKTATRDRRKDSFSVFARYLKEYGYTDDNIMPNLGRRSRKKKNYNADDETGFNPRILTDTELSRLFKLISESTAKNHIRDLCIFLMLAELGIRRCTLQAARWEDINFHDKCLTLRHDKGKKMTRVELPDNLANVLKVYKSLKPKKFGYIFGSRGESPMSSSNYQTIVKKWLSTAGINNANSQQKSTGHTLRHTFITRMIRNNVSLYKIAEYTGSTIESLLPYVHLVKGDMADVTKIAHIDVDYDILAS